MIVNTAFHCINFGLKLATEYQRALQFGLVGRVFGDVL